MELQDQRHLIAAEGWLELGDAQEAAEELKQISPENRDHPLVLGLRWQICAKAKQWDVALETASTLIQSAPEHPLGWVHRSYCLHELKRTEEARDNLLRVVEKFPDDPIMRYNLACYECQLGRLDKAKSWLQKALERGDRQKIRSMALEDLDLQPLWKEIEDL